MGIVALPAILPQGRAGCKRPSPGRLAQKKGGPNADSAWRRGFKLFGGLAPHWQAAKEKKPWKSEL